MLLKRISLLLIFVALSSMFVSCEKKPLPPLEPGTCPVCRGSGTITTTESVYDGLQPVPGPPGQPQQAMPKYRIEIKTSKCSTCGGTGKAK